MLALVRHCKSFKLLSNLNHANLLTNVNAFLIMIDKENLNGSMFELIPSSSLLTHLDRPSPASWAPGQSLKTFLFCCCCCCKWLNNPGFAVKWDKRGGA